MERYSPIRRARILCGIPMSELAKAAGVTYCYLSKIEIGYVNPGRRVKHSLAIALGWDEKELFPRESADAEG